MRALLSLTLVAILSVSAEAQAPLVVGGRALPPKEKFDTSTVKEISDGPSGISQLFWENQNDIQEQILNALSDISVGVHLDHEVTDNIVADVWGDVHPRHRVYRINTGNVEDGTPDDQAESYYLVVDQLKSVIRAALRYEDIVGDLRFGAGPAGFEGAEIIRKLTPVRSYEQYRENVNRTSEKYFERFRSGNPDESGLVTSIKQGLRWTYGAVAYAYDRMEALFRNTSQILADDDSTKIFFVVPFNGVRTKARMFSVNHANFLENVAHGETLDLVRYLKTGLLGVNAGLGDARLGYSPNVIQVQSQRTARRVTNAECSMPTTNCQEVILSMRYTITKGHEVGIYYKPGIGPFSIRIADTNRRKHTFREIEKVYRLDLSRRSGQEAFDIFFSDFKPSYSEWDRLPVVNEGEAAKLLRVYYRGKNANGKDSREDSDVFNVNSDGKIELGIYSRRMKKTFAEYPMCITDIVDGKETNRRCNYSAQSTHSSRHANRIKWVRDNEANYVGLVGLSNADIENRKESDDKTTNLHFAIHYNDRNAEDYNSVAEKAKKLIGFRDYYDKLANIRTALAVDQMPELYEQSGFKDMAERLNALKNKYRKVENSLQNLALDIYMDETFTKTILECHPDEVKAIISSFKIAPETKRDLLKAFVDTYKKPGEYQVKALVRLYNSKGRRPYFAGLMMMLGKDHVRMANEGHLAIRFRSEASDFSDAEKYKEIIVGTGLRTLEKKIFIPRSIFSDPDPGVARISQIRLYVKSDTQRTSNPRIYLEFLANIKSTPNGQPLSLAGKISKFKLFLADEKLADVKVDNVVPHEKIDGNYRYIIELGDVTHLRLDPSTDYTLQFQLEDPTLSDVLPSKRLTETREAAFNL